MPAAIFVGSWKGFGFYMLMLLAGLQSIPTDLYEAGRIDGAGRLALFHHITLPGLRPVLFSSILLGIIWTANYFDAIYILTGGGPARLTETLPIFVFVTAFTNFNINEAIAASNLLLLLVVALLVIYIVAFSRFSTAVDRGL
jgi:multiple sugar transport system permease protein